MSTFSSGLPGQRPGPGLRDPKVCAIELCAGRENIFQDPGFHVWCGSVIPWGGCWWLFYSRWPESAGFDAWATHSEIALACGTSPVGPFQPQDHVLLPVAGGHGWESGAAHNPTVVQRDGRLFMAYMANCGPVAHAGVPSEPVRQDDDWWAHRNNQRIGVATAARPEGPWGTTPGPVLDVDPAGWDSLLVNNPSIFQKSDGRWAMIYKGVASGPPPFGGDVLHGLAEAPGPAGPYHRVSGVHPFAVPGIKFPAEDPFAWWDQASGIYRAIVKDMNGALTGLGRTLAFYQSVDGRDWVNAARPPISGSEIRWNDGVVEKFGRIERPQVTFDTEGRPVALQLACLRDEPGSVSFSLSVPIEPGFFDFGPGGGVP